MKTLKKIALIIFLGIIITGCSKEIPKLSNGDELVVTFKEGQISANDLYNQIKEKYGIDTLINMVDSIMFEKKYGTTDEETKYISDKIESIKKAAKSNSVTYEYALNYYGYSSEEDIKLEYRKNIAVIDYLKKNLTEKEINNYYENSYYGDINAKHILIQPETLSGMTTEEKDAANDKALETAKDIIKKLKAGEDFSELAKKYSDDPGTKDVGGDLGWFNTGQMVEEFEKAAFALKKGKYTTTPVKTNYGYHIILKVDEKEKPALKDSAEDIKTKMVNKMLAEDNTLLAKTLIDIRKESKMDIVDSTINEKYEEFLKTVK